MPKEITGKKTEYFILVNGVDGKIKVCFYADKGKVIRFSVTFLIKLDGRWKDIRRCDNSHEGTNPHCHIYSYAGGRRKETKLYMQGEPGKLLTGFIKDFKQHHAIIVADYKLAYDNKRK